MAPAARSDKPKVTDEKKGEKFVTLARTRMGAALAAIERVGKLASPRSYKFNAEQVAAITKALNDATHEIGAKFDAALKAPEKTATRTKREWNF